MRSRLCFSCGLLTVLFLLFSASPSKDMSARGASANAQSAYFLQTSVIGSAGSFGTSENYKTAGTLGQSTPIGVGSSANKTLRVGFWGRCWIATGTEEIPVVFRNLLYQNFPNPFNPSTTVEYSVAKRGPVELTIYSVTGQRIRTLVRENRAPGGYAVIWDGRNDSGKMVSTGIYFCRLRIGSFVSVKKMILLK